MSRSYGSVRAVKQLSLTVKKGESAAIIGPKGAGKTTTLKMIAGLLKRDSGEVTVNGLSPFEARRSFGYLPGDATPYLNFSVRQNLEYMAALREVPRAAERVEELIGSLNLTDYERFSVTSLLSASPPLSLSVIFYRRLISARIVVCAVLVTRPLILFLNDPGSTGSFAVASTFLLLFI